MSSAWIELRDQARDCHACPLWQPATQIVFGEGPVPARIMLVGEQPGDVEDRQGHPFVGPAGGVLDRALEAAGIAREDAYLTNAVKHFKFEPRGKRRIHKTPNAGEVRACHPWLDAELATVAPRLVVLLGATAAKSILGPSFRLTKARGVPLDSPIADVVTATIHPSAVLRSSSEEREAAFAGLTADLRASLELLAAA